MRRIVTGIAFLCLWGSTALAAPGDFTEEFDLDESITRHDLVRVQQQHREQGTLLRAAEVEIVSTGVHLQRAENSKLHAASGAVRVARCDVNAFRGVRIDPPFTAR